MQASAKKRHWLRNILIAVAASFFLVCICLVLVINQGSKGTTSKTSNQNIKTQETQALPINTPAPTNTSTQTNIPAPTNTPLPTLTPTPPPEPISLQGKGDDVVDFQKWEGAALIKVTHNGGGNFAVWNDDANGEHIDLLINTIGHYQGTLPLDFMADEHTTRFEVNAGGPWEIQILPLAQVRRETIPGTFSGTGDEVILLDSSAKPDLLKADASAGHGNFTVYTYGNRRDLVINEIAPYTGTVPIGLDTIIISIGAEGTWTVEITTR